MSDAPINIDAVRKWLDTPLFPHLPGHAPVAAIRGLCDEVVSLRAERDALQARAENTEAATERAAELWANAVNLWIERDAALGVARRNEMKRQRTEGGDDDE